MIAASIAPAAARVWPICPFEEDTATLATASPRHCAMARASITSLSGVAVPWALM